jgi:hypothetical protein
MRPNPSVIEPEVVKQLELNGPANIVMHVQMRQRQGLPIDTSYIRYMAVLFDRYVAVLETGQKIYWHEFLAEQEKKASKKR